MKRSELGFDEIGEFYWNYLRLIPEDAELIDCLKRNTHDFTEFLKTIPKEKWNDRYAPDKWSIAQMIQHILDTERIFQYRALSFARGENKPLPGFDHDFYAMNYTAEDRTASDLIREFRAIRESGIFLFRSFSEDMLGRIGNMNEMNATPRAIGFIMAGHVLHHKDVIEKRYI
ncbi:DinB family protein [Gramella sp. GC03-9]|uniref:DinB family protein n=1 Tax=Christiangramia oceanisediminis TaxID=2920386 RepID=A0A9X2KXZ3_9FLAO|nr:DinB family protein [Gramella oceanisediminis]MCP9200324.1 DinB family protein [Gramella oceanisediminis]